MTAVVNKDIIIGQLPDDYKADTFINDLFTAIGVVLDDLSSDMTEVDEQRFFSKLTVLLRDSEKLLALNHLEIVDDARSAIQAKWLGYGKCDLPLIQMVCNCWKNGEVEVSILGRYIYVREVMKMTVGELENTPYGKFKGANSYSGVLKILLTFNGALGIPSDLPSLLSAIDEVKPAHLAYAYEFKWLLKKNIHNVMTKAEMQTYKKSNFARGVK